MSSGFVNFDLEINGNVYKKKFDGKVGRVGFVEIFQLEFYFENLLM